MRSKLIKISKNNATWINLESQYGVIPTENGADYILAPPIKSYQTINYIEEAGERIYPVTAEEPFDYKIELACIGTELEANSRVRSFYNYLSPLNTSGQRVSEEVSLYIAWCGITVVGYLKSLNVKDMKYSSSDGKSIWIFDLTIRVTDPLKCNFSATEPI